MNTTQRTRIFGPPCSMNRLVRAELWGQRVLVHVLLHDHLIHTARAAHEALNAVGAHLALPKRIDSYNCRRIAGSSSWSLHAWGLAFDIFRTPPGVPPPGGVYTPTLALHPAFIDAFEDHGWRWGGRWARPDRPHFEWNGVPPTS